MKSKQKFTLLIYLSYKKILTPKFCGGYLISCKGYYREKIRLKTKIFDMPSVKSEVWKINVTEGYNVFTEFNKDTTYDVGSFIVWQSKGGLLNYINKESEFYYIEEGKEVKDLKGIRFSFRVDCLRYMKEYKLKTQHIYDYKNGTDLKSYEVKWHTMAKKEEVHSQNVTIRLGVNIKIIFI